MSLIVEFTCDCGSVYSLLTGDLDERMCNECLEAKCSSMNYKEHHAEYFRNLLEEEDGMLCTVCNHYWYNDTIAQEMEIGEYAD